MGEANLSNQKILQITNNGESHQRAVKAKKLLIGRSNSTLDLVTCRKLFRAI